MGRKDPLWPPGSIDELWSRLEALEADIEALKGAINAFITVYAVRRLDPPKGGGQ